MMQHIYITDLCCIFTSDLVRTERGKESRGRGEARKEKERIGHVRRGEQRKEKERRGGRR